MRPSKFSEEQIKLMVNLVKVHSTTRDIAQIFNMSYAMVKYIFKRETGLSITEYQSKDYIGKFNKFYTTGVDNNCSVWTGGIDKGGYGQASGFFSEIGERKAHRVSYVLAYGPIPEDLLVRHKCDNPPCIRPDHLELGTSMDNFRDMVERDRLNVSGRFKIKEKCIRGHLLSGDNIKFSSGRRYCVPCVKDRRLEK